MTMLSKNKTVIPIQSFSDLITNSSSEVFCTITAEKDILKQIMDILSVVIKDNSYDEYEPTIEYLTKEEKAEENWYTEKELAEFPEQWIEVDMPYCMSASIEFYKAGIKALLDSHNIKDYTIKYE